MSEPTKELQDEIVRLKDLIRSLEREHDVRSCRVEFGPFDGSANLHFVVTAPTAIDEIDFGQYIASTVALLLRAGGVQAAKFGQATDQPPTEGTEQGG